MPKLKPETNEGFVQPEPGNALLRIEKIDFRKITEGDYVGELKCDITYEVADHVQNEDSIGLQTREYFGLYEISGRYFGINNLLGVILKATGKTLEVDPDYFEDEGVQEKITKKLTGLMFGGTLVKSKDGKYINLKSYITKDEFKESRERFEKAGLKDKSKSNKTEEKAAPVKEDAGDDWD